MATLQDTQIVKVDGNIWKFPKQINFETASSYTQKFINLQFEESVIFDLSETENVHSSFIGFLIDLKQRIDRNGGILTIHPSPSLEKLLNVINLYDFFLA